MDIFIKDGDRFYRTHVTATWAAERNITGTLVVGERLTRGTLAKLLTKGLAVEVDESECGERF